MMPFTTNSDTSTSPTFSKSRPWFQPERLLYLLLFGVITTLAGCGSASPAPSTNSEGKNPTQDNQDPDEEFLDESVDELRNQIGLSPNASGLGSGLSQRPLNPDFRILFDGEVAFKTSASDGTQKAFTLRGSGAKSCQLFEQLPSGELKAKAIYFLENGKLKGLNPETKEVLFEIRSAAAKILLDDFQGVEKGKKRRTTIRTASTSVKIYRRGEEKDQLLASLESSPNRWQQKDQAGNLTRVASVENRIGKIIDAKGRETVSGSPIRDPFGFAFLGIDEIPVKQRIALCIYLHQE